MKLDSKYFDSIRVASKRERAEPTREERLPRCQWKGCKSAADHRALWRPATSRGPVGAWPWWTAAIRARRRAAEVSQGGRSG